MSTPTGTQSVFFAYPFRPQLRAETVRSAIEISKRNGVEAMGWEELGVGGRVVIDVILDAINERDAVVAEVSSLNPNVLFELGYAIGRGKAAFPVIDEMDEDAVRNWRSLSLVDTLGRIDYGDDASRLAGALHSRLVQDEPVVLESLLAGGAPREENCIFAPGVATSFHAAQRLERYWARQGGLQILGQSEDLRVAQLRYFAQAIYRSSAIVLLTMPKSRKFAAVHNAQASLLGGIARGLDLPLLMLGEESADVALDYRELFYNYHSVADLIEHVDGWIRKLPATDNSRRKMGRLNLETELPVRSFGQYVAESESAALDDYFIHTNEFEAVLSGRASVFVGRKGTGKTAAMLQAAGDLRRDRRILTVPIKPTSYDVASLVELIGSFSEVSQRDYFLLQLWTYLITTEIAARVLTVAGERPAGTGGTGSLADLQEVFVGLGLNEPSRVLCRFYAGSGSRVSAA